MAGTPPTPSSAPALDTIAFVFDSSIGDADLVNGPALAALELVAEEEGGLDIEPVDVGEGGAEALAELGADPSVAAVVIGPWTVPPEGGPEILAEAGVPVVSLSWPWGPPDDPAAPWISAAAGVAREARTLLRAAAGSSGRLCASGARDAMSRRLLAQIEAERRLVGIHDLPDLGTVDPARPATAVEVAGRLADARCDELVWTGGAEAAGALLAATRGPLRLVGTSRMKTDEALALVADGARIRTVCVCADVTLSSRPPHQRFVHDFQASSGGAPGPFAVEAYDVGRLLVRLLRAGSGTRADVAAGLARVDGFGGLAGRHEPSRADPERLIAADPGAWRGRGSRWLPIRSVP